MNHEIKIQKYDHIDIYAKNGKCPICEKVLTTVYVGCHCQNGCYLRYKLSTSDIKFIIFGYSFEITEDDRTNGLDSHIEEQVAKEIFYWKENDRYVMKILTQGE